MRKHSSICTALGCERIVTRRGLCPRHLWRMKHHGSTDLPGGETTVERFWARVEKTDGCWNWTRSLCQGYGSVGEGRKLIKAHRISYELAYGALPPGMQVDHICHNRACVRPDHLRLVTNKQNAENRSGLPKNNTSGVLGVSWRESRKRWVANVRHNGVLHHVGYFRDLKDAEAAVIAKRNELFTHNSLDRSA